MLNRKFKVLISSFGFGRNRGFDRPRVNRNYCNKLSHILMDFGKIEPVSYGSYSISTKLRVWFLPKHTFQRVSLVTSKKHELYAHSVILILRNILAILDPLVLSVHFWFTFGFADCISVSVLVRPNV